MSLRVDKIYDRRVAWDHQLSQFNSEPYLQLSYEATRAVSNFANGINGSLTDFFFSSLD